MTFVINDKLKEFMASEGYKNIFLYADMCNTWGGTALSVLARFVDEEEVPVEICDKFETEVGNVFVSKKGIKCEDTVTLGFSNFMGQERVTVVGAEAIQE